MTCLNMICVHKVKYWKFTTSSPPKLVLYVLVHYYYTKCAVSNIKNNHGNHHQDRTCISPRKIMHYSSWGPDNHLLLLWGHVPHMNSVITARGKLQGSMDYNRENLSYVYDWGSFFLYICLQFIIMCWNLSHFLVLFYIFDL